MVEEQSVRAREEVMSLQHWADWFWRVTQPPFAQSSGELARLRPAVMSALIRTSRPRVNMKLAEQHRSYEMFQEVGRGRLRSLLQARAAGPCDNRNDAYEVLEAYRDHNAVLRVGSTNDGLLESTRRLNRHLLHWANVHICAIRVEWGVLHGDQITDVCLAQFLSARQGTYAPNDFLKRLGELVGAAANRAGFIEISNPKRKQYGT